MDNKWSYISLLPSRLFRLLSHCYSNDLVSLGNILSLNVPLWILLINFPNVNYISVCHAVSLGKMHMLLTNIDFYLSYRVLFFLTILPKNCDALLEVINISAYFGISVSPKSLFKLLFLFSKICSTCKWWKCTFLYLLVQSCRMYSHFVKCQECYTLALIMKIGLWTTRLFKLGKRYKVAFMVTKLHILLCRHINPVVYRPTAFLYKT